MLKKILLSLLVIVVILVALFVVIIGPWPTYASTDFENAGYYKKALAAIDENVADSTLNGQPDRLRAGWASAKLTPPIGTPLSGFGDRKGKPSTGVHDELYVKALALSDGDDTVVITGSDMLIVPENVAELVRDRVAKDTDLTADDILFNSTHTHSGPGAWGPGILAKQFSGTYDPSIVTFVADAFSEAVLAANEALEPAEIAQGGVDAEQYIRNRTRDAAVDGELSYLVVRQEDGDELYLASFSAHPTILGGSNMEFSGDYPGYLQRALSDETGGFAMYLGGALGSMSNRAPEAADSFAKAEALGQALAALVLEDAKNATFNQEAEIGSIGIPLDLPPMQFRLNKSWRLSPFFFGLVGIDKDAWLHGVRIGDTLMFGFPSDFSGEISVDLKAWARERDLDLWALSFNGDYVGYISPDKYYADADQDEEGYEMYVMSWCGPNQEAYFTSLTKHMAGALAPSLDTES